nr:hypothetical protein [Azospirillum formosense]
MALGNLIPAIDPTLQTRPLHPEEDPFTLFQQKLADHVPTSSCRSQTAGRLEKLWRVRRCGDSLVLKAGGGSMAGQAGLFDLQDRYAELSKSGDPLERLSVVVDFEFSVRHWTRPWDARIAPGAVGHRWTR